MPASLKHLTDKKLNLTSVLARWKDGLYYSAAIVKCDKTSKRCLVCFEDGSEVWVNNKDVHIQLTMDQLSEEEDIVCCVCDDGKSEPPDEIILCDVCQQGYHQKCHTPPVDSSKIDESEETSEHKDWFCATCSYILNQSDRAKLTAVAQQQRQNLNQKQQLPPNKSKQQPQTQTQSKQQPQTLASTRSKPYANPSPQQDSPKLVASPIATTSKSGNSKQPVKVKQTSPIVEQAQKTIGPVKSVASPQQRQAPYYSLSNQPRAASTSSTAALANLTASSALVVGSSAGRSKQDLVNMSNKSSQRQQRNQQNPETEIVPPIKHAVRKSGVNFMVPQVRQSALPTATRSILPSIPAQEARNSTKADTCPQQIPPRTMGASMTQSATTTPSVITTTTNNNTNSTKPSSGTTNQVQVPVKTTKVQQVNMTGNSISIIRSPPNLSKEIRAVPVIHQVISDTAKVSGSTNPVSNSPVTSPVSSTTNSAATNSSIGVNKSIADVNDTQVNVITSNQRSLNSVAAVIVTTNKINSNNNNTIGNSNPASSP